MPKFDESDLVIMGELDPDPTTMIYMVRHGETDDNKEKKFRGWGMESLNEEGKQDAKDAANILRDIDFDKIYTSDLPRARETAQIINEAQKSPRDIVQLRDLRTIDCGLWTGELISKVGPLFAALQKKWQDNPFAYAPAGESWQNFQARQLAAWGMMLAKDRHKTICVVSHLRCCIWAMGYAMLSKALSGQDIEVLDHIYQYPGKVTVMSYSRKQGFKIMEVSSSEIGDAETNP